jgi:solute:Na+ symporter, SSS family
VLAFFTFNSGLRAPALLSILKDILLLVTVVVLLEWFTLALGGWPHIFGVATASFAQRPVGAGSIVLPPGTQLSYVSLALGSAMSNFLYPHVLTGTLAARNRSTVRTGLSTLPVYTLLLGWASSGCSGSPRSRPGPGLPGVTSPRSSPSSCRPR